ncbi:MAG: hypothetical protein RDV41_02615 [Planctomycetota bacterium]|nr:hypothetical protein [Planctomycetota bacterium]
MRVLRSILLTVCMVGLAVPLVHSQAQDGPSLEQRVRELEAKIKDLTAQLECMTLKAEGAAQDLEKANARIGLLEAYIAQKNLPLPADGEKPPMDAERLRRCNERWESAGYRRYDDFWIKLTRVQEEQAKRSQHFTQEYQITGSIAYIGSDREVTGVALAIEFMEGAQTLGSALVNARISDDPTVSRSFDCSLVVEIPTDPCQTCASKGSFPCAWCEGKAKLPCSACQGKGRLPSGKRCPTCNGTGFLKCTRCKGTGITECTTCWGAGRVERPSKAPSRRIRIQELLKDKPK